MAIMDYGYVTHAVHANSRMVFLKFTREGASTLKIEGPPSGDIYPPGPGWLHVIVEGVPSKGVKIMVGDGSGPPVDSEALEKCVVHSLEQKVLLMKMHCSLLSNTAVDQYEASKGGDRADDDSAE